MPDFIDRVQELEAHRSELINQAGRLQDAPLGPTHCSCGEAIPERRRRAVPGCATCVDCAEQSAARGQHFHRPR